MNLNEFYQKWNGKYAEFNNDAYKNQCKDLFSFYNRDVAGNPNYIPGDAWQLYEACPAAYYTKVSNPVKGDIAIWKKEFGGYGHVAIVWDNGQFFSQNYPLGAPCFLQTIPTNKILGYLRPNNMNYENKVIRNIANGEFAFVLAGVRRVITKERAGFAALTAYQRKTEIVNVAEGVYNSIPRGVDF